MTRDRDYNENETFRGGPKWHLNACVGSNGGPYEAHRMAKGFGESASALKRLAEARLITLDLAVYPLCFAYRQALELWLKAINEEIDLKFPGSQLGPSGHNLDILMQSIRRCKSDLFEFAISKVDLEFLESVVSDWQDIDPRGTSFRYPGDREVRQYLDGWSLINLDVLESRHDRVIDILTRCHSQLKFDQDYR